jgi:predicted cobalt transporter CbtA
VKALTFIIITLFSGAIAGTLLGLINQVLVEPFIDKAIGIETQRNIAKGEVIDSAQQSQYRVWQKGGEIIAASIYGTAIAALFGIVFVYARNMLPGSNSKNKALFLSAIMFFVLFFVPVLKYPANPPAVGDDPVTIYYREILYIGFIAVSGFSTLVLALWYKKIGNNQTRKIVLTPVVIYAILMIGAYLIFPPNPDKITIPVDLITNFRIASAFSIGVFWGLLGITFGLLWDKFKPYETSKIVSSSA